MLMWLLFSLHQDATLWEFLSTWFPAASWDTAFLSTFTTSTGTSLVTKDKNKEGSREAEESEAWMELWVALQRQSNG